MPVRAQHDWLTVAQVPDAADFPRAKRKPYPEPGSKVEHYQQNRLEQIALGARASNQAYSRVLTDKAARCGALAVLARQDEDAALDLIGSRLYDDHDDAIRATALDLLLESTSEKAERLLDALVTDKICASRREEVERALAWHGGDTQPDAVPYTEMVRIEAGTFLMGSPADEGGPSEWPQRKVAIEQSFEIGKYPVSFAEFDEGFRLARTLRPGER